MTRVRTPKATSALLLSTCLAGCQFSGLDSGSSLETADAIGKQNPPNIIVLFADDMGYGDLGSYGTPNILTPELDRLAAEGQRWTNFYVGAPVCSPSRGSLMTGNYPERSGLYGRKRAVLFPGDEGRIPDSTMTLPEALKSLGYSTALFGKWHLGDSPDGLPTRHGFDVWLGIPYSNDMDWMVGPTSPEIFAAGASGDTAFVAKAIADRKTYTLNPKNEYWNVPFMRSAIIQSSTVTSPNGQDSYQDEVLERPPDQSLMTKHLTEASVDYIQDHANADQPFFLYLAYSMPHAPIFASDEFQRTSAGGRYGDVIEELDWSVGKIRATLEVQGIAENTLVVFSSDNGPWLSMDQHSGSAGPLKHGKGTTFEGGQRVPAIIWWPGGIEPGVVQGIGTIMDLYATSVALAGGSLSPQVQDSIDLSPALRGEDSPRDSFAYYRSGELYAFRKGPYKLHLITQGAYGIPPARTVHEHPLLYHLGEDPGEKFDIAESEPEVVAELLEAVALHRAGIDIAEPIFDIDR